MGPQKAEARGKDSAGCGGIKKRPREKIGTEEKRTE